MDDIIIGTVRVRDSRCVRKVADASQSPADLSLQRGSEQRYICSSFSSSTFLYLRFQTRVWTSESAGVQKLAAIVPCVDKDLRGQSIAQVTYLTQSQF